MIGGISASAHAQAQVLRFLRLFVSAFVPLFLASGDKVTWWSLAALIPPALETTLRQFKRVKPVGPPGGN